jgi:hypothetical protein
VRKKKQTSGPERDGSAREKLDPQALRPLNLPRPLRVRTGAGGRPRFLYLGGGAKKVQHIREIWQIDDEWWRDPISRRYATLVLEGGQTLTVYRDLRDRRWYLQEG